MSSSSAFVETLAEILDEATLRQALDSAYLHDWDADSLLSKFRVAVMEAGNVHISERVKAMEALDEIQQELANYINERMK